MTKEEFTQLFFSKGGNQSELDAVVKEIETLILKKALFAYIEKLDPTERNKVHAMDAMAASEYLNTRKDQLPTISQEEFKKISSGVWQSYVDSVLN